MAQPPQAEPTSLKRQLGLTTATLVIIANVIGAGIFGTTGLIQAEIGQPLVVILMWAVGGLIALAGALCYAEIASAIPEDGGDYVYLRKLYGPRPSFLCGWISCFVGFAAPSAVLAMLFTEYFDKLLEQLPQLQWMSLGLSAKLLAVVLIVLTSLMHIVGVRKGGFLQNILTVMKVALLLAFVVKAATLLPTGGAQLLQDNLNSGSLNYGGLGVSLLFVMFSYSGWNAASYLGGEVKNPSVNLPKALFRGTVITTILYVLINIAFYVVTEASAISGEKAVAALVSQSILGDRLAALLNIAFCVVLLSALSANVMLGPRVCYAMAKDKMFFSQTAKIHPRWGTPVNAIVFQALVSIIYIIVGRYEEILTYMGFALSLFPMLTVAGLFKLRKHPSLGQHESVYRIPLYPILPIFFLLSMGFIVVISFMGRPLESCVALLVLLCGLPFSRLFEKKISDKNLQTTHENFERS